MHLEVADRDEVNGINNRRQLAQCEALLQQRLRDHRMKESPSLIPKAAPSVKAAASAAMW